MGWPKQKIQYPQKLVRKKCDTIKFPNRILSGHDKTVRYPTYIGSITWDARSLNQEFFAIALLAGASSHCLSNSYCKPNSLRWVLKHLLMRTLSRRIETKSKKAFYRLIRRVEMSKTMETPTSSETHTGGVWRNSRWYSGNIYWLTLTPQFSEQQPASPLIIITPSYRLLFTMEVRFSGINVITVSYPGPLLSPLGNRIHALYNRLNIWYKNNLY